VLRAAARRIDDEAAGNEETVGRHQGLASAG
jgi:hypothetical protein